jgi:hypothetical protein
LQLSQVPSFIVDGRNKRLDKKSPFKNELQKNMRTGAGEKPFRILLAQEKEGKGFLKRANKKSPSCVVF